jgi:hypothetical protein
LHRLQKRLAVCLASFALSCDGGQDLTRWQAQFLLDRSLQHNGQSAWTAITPRCPQGLWGVGLFAGDNRRFLRGPVKITGLAKHREAHEATFEVELTGLKGWRSASGSATFTKFDDGWRVGGINLSDCTAAPVQEQLASKSPEPPASSVNKDPPTAPAATATAQALKKPLPREEEIVITRQWSDFFVVEPWEWLNWDRLDPTVEFQAENQVGEQLTYPVGLERTGERRNFKGEVSRIRFRITNGGSDRLTVRLSYIRR